jgi:PE family
MDMSYVIAAPEMMTSAATDLAAIGSDLSAAHAAAAASTPAAADEVSASIAQVFSQQGYQALAGQAAAFHEQFVQNLSASAGSYASIEAAIASFLQNLNANVNQVLNSNQLIGDIYLAGALVVGGAYLLTLYAEVALRQYLTTGKFCRSRLLSRALQLVLNLVVLDFYRPSFAGSPAMGVIPILLSCTPILLSCTSIESCMTIECHRAMVVV